MTIRFRRPSRLRGLAAAGITCLVLASLSSVGGASAQADPASGIATPVRLATAAANLEPGPVPELSTETSTTTREADGSYTAEISAGPVNYQDDSGDWVPISNELVDAPGSVYAAQNEANSYTVSIPQNPATTPVKFEEDGAWVTMKIVGADDAEPAMEGAEAVFTNLAGADEVRYEATYSGVKETIVLDSPPTVAPSYAYTLRVSPGITPVLTADQTVEFRDDSGVARFLIPPGFMSDSAEPESAYSDAVTYTLAQTGSSWRFTLTPSATWLNDSSRVYPVMIDPTVDKITQKSCWLQEEQAGTTHCGEWILKAGANENLKKRRALLDFNVNGIPTNAQVSNATAWIWLDHYSTSGSGGATSWALYNPSQLWGTCASWMYTCHNGGTWTGGGSQGQISSNTQSIGGSSSGWQSWDITGKAAGWINGTHENRGVLLRQTGENVKKVLGFVSQAHNATWAHPLLRVTYTVNAAPSVSATTVSPETTGANNTWTTPTFSASATDPEGQSVAISFEVQTSTGGAVWSGWSDWGPSGGTRSVTIPAGKLGVDRDYRVRAASIDAAGALSAWSGFTSFRVNEPGPEFVDDSPLDPEPPTSTAYPGVDSYELRDLQKAAQIYGITLQQAVDRYGNQIRFADRVAQVRSAHPGNFASAEWRNDSTGAPTVHFAYGIPTDAAAYFADMPVAVSIAGDAEYNETEALALVRSAHDGVVVAEAAVDSDVTTYFDDVSQEVITEVLRHSTQLSAPTAAQLETAARDEMQDANPSLTPPDVEAQLSVGEPGRPAALRGGVKIGGPGGTCTSGFPVKDTQNGELGFITARHCDNDITTYSVGGSNPRERLEHASRFLPENWGDIQYHKAKDEKVKRQSYVAVGIFEQIQGVSSPEKDMFVCLFGRRTNGYTASDKPTCSEVRKTGVSVHYENEDGDEWDFDYLVMVDDHVGYKGDSGGPWYYGGTAVGIYSGWKNTGIFGQTDRDVFSRVERDVLGLMNLKVYDKNA